MGAGPLAALDVGDGDGVGFHDQVADGDDQALVVDHDAVALALRAQGLGRAAVLRNGGVDADHGRQRVGHCRAAGCDDRRASAPRRPPGRSATGPQPFAEPFNPRAMRHPYITVGASSVCKDRRLRAADCYMTVHGAPRRSVRNHRRSRAGRSRAGAARRCVHGPSRRAERGAAPGRDPRGRAAAGAGRRRHRQDARADHAHRPSADHRPRPALADPGRHLHQQGGARNARSRREPDRRRGRRHVARHLPLDRRARAAPPCRAGRAEEQLHHPRHRRPDAADQAAAAGRGHRRQEMAGPRAVAASSSAGRTAR